MRPPQDSDALALRGKFVVKNVSGASLPLPDSNCALDIGEEVDLMDPATHACLHVGSYGNLGGITGGASVGIPPLYITHSLAQAIADGNAQVIEDTPPDYSVLTF